MILNTGMRTDIPAYFSEWFYNRLREGYVLTRNPYYPEQVIRYRISPDVVDCLAFCTKNPLPMMERFHELDAFRQFWFMTITPYGREIEPNVLPVSDSLDALIRLSSLVGISSVGWRYDPIFLTKDYDLDFHIRSFEQMASRLSGFVDNCVISFIDLYAKTRRNFPGVREVSPEEQDILAKAFVKIGTTYGIRIRTCCEGTRLASYGVDVAGCMTKQIMERATGCALEVPHSRRSLREGCSCLLGNDIGMYNTCSHGCIYCYANYDQETVRRNVALHDPASPFLIGGARPGDKIHDADQKSWANGQMSLFSCL
jgi:hypothetical protein